MFMITSLTQIQPNLAKRLRPFDLLPKASGRDDRVTKDLGGVYPVHSQSNLMQSDALRCAL